MCSPGVAGKAALSVECGCCVASLCFNKGLVYDAMSLIFTCVHSLAPLLSESWRIFLELLQN